ncbi:hypothetical protein EYF80_043677 [Liparis tanakae]|uniref:Uncharacterized protein n=1 Tax=Liparis tanakae TaxID=230148 RepID=A0A4Z2FYQ9_9TELE|nr:hypothetical protein EYF80_043677 [Liparis tanakae]
MKKMKMMQKKQKKKKKKKKKKKMMMMMKTLTATGEEGERYASQHDLQGHRRAAMLESHDAYRTKAAEHYQHVNASLDGQVKLLESAQRSFPSDTIRRSRLRFITSGLLTDDEEEGHRGRG